MSSLPSVLLKATALLAVSASLSLAQTTEKDEAAARHFFESEIRPILVNRCQECHGAEKVKGGLRLDTFHGFDEGGDSGPAVVRGNLEESMLIQAIRYQDPDFQMPPKKQLPASEVALLEKWVAMGAPWPDSGPVRADSDEPRFSEKDRSHWSFQPVTDPKPPAVTKDYATWAKSPIDAFVLAKQAEQKLSPATAADRHELVRRAYFDLHGLPPTEAETRAFVEDRAPDAYSRLLDRLLASPRYGERWAQHWLDLVRYAESDGYRQDAFRPSAWPYRDWVIKSLNRDMPYNEFVRLQLAGDEIDPKNPDILVATSYLRNGIYEYNLRDVRGQLDTIMTDITDVTGEVFLGLSFSCARCHNHKFDPILQSDYFSLRSFFEPVLWRTDLKLATDAEVAAHAEKQAAWEKATADVRARINALVGAHVEKAVQVDRDRYPDDIKAMMAKPMSELDPLEKQLVTIANRKPEEVRELSPLRYLKTPEEKQAYQDLLTELKTFDSLKPEPLLDALVATDVSAQAPATIMKTRRGEQKIDPSFLTVLNPDAPDIQARADSTGRRTALANWITRADNPLSTRVIVNRVWQYHFGRGIAATANDFGNLGEVPTHPELLDWLTSRFIEGGWSLKKLHKLIMLSATYQQTSRRPPTDDIAKIDPTNRYLWRFTPPRLDAEQVRDSILMASGELDLKEGGPSTDAMTGRRRSIYTIKKRNSQ
ncbi:MAG TPA: PSD1 and planctomycete cytochrome C domain-containing protein, partial [Opitutaceae bacterium]|nr:PSD1 and planctomycete cytochrome C domain-containing protein [Opitutaceae bacterium]